MSNSLLLYAQASVYRGADGSLFVERQAQNGMRRWAENFQEVTVVTPEGDGPPPAGWLPWTGDDRISIELVPEAYSLARFVKQFSGVRRRLSRLIDEADYLVFAIGGLWGDWGAVGAIEAHRKGRGFAVWTDKVESEVARRFKSASRGRQRLKAKLYHRPMAALEKYVISRADLGLFHGAECYEFYQGFPRIAALAHDIHVEASDRISESALGIKLDTVRTGPLYIGYAGRVHWSKGWADWLEVLARLRSSGMEFRATWLGDGEDMGKFRESVERLSLGDLLELPGFVDDRAATLNALSEFDVLLFCHKTKESPRNLIEALMRGTPIVGYRDAYSRDLICRNGGGQLVDPDDVDALVSTLKHLASDRDHLARLTSFAARDGTHFDTETVFRDRSEAVKAHVRRKGQAGFATDSVKPILH